MSLMKTVNRVLFLLMLMVGFSTAQAASEMSDKPSPESVDGATTVDAAAAKALFDQGALFVDVRTAKGFDAGRIPDAVLLDLKKNYTKESLGAEAAAGDPIVIYCNGINCWRSAKAAKKAISWGYTKVNYFRGGFPAWKKAGYPVE